LFWFLSTAGSALAGTLFGSFTTLPPGANINLTSEGLLDWTHWGLAASDEFNHRANTTQLITNFTVIGSAGVQQFGDNATGYSWSDGTPVAQANNETAGIYVDGLENGFEVNVVADTTVRTLKLYVGAYAARMKFEASLSDSSAPGYSETNFVNASDGPNAVFTIAFAAGSTGQHLTVRFTVFEDLDSGNVTLQAAALREAAPLIELVRPASGAIFYNSTNGIQFKASTLAPNSIPAGQIHLFLNGRDMTNGLSLTGTALSRTATFSGLSADILYDGQIVVADDLGRATTNSFRFDTFTTGGSVLIEAEDYNYSDGVCVDGTLSTSPTVGGRFQDNPPASGFDAVGGQIGGLQGNGTRLGYVGAVGLPEVDFSDTTGTPGLYRSCDLIETEVSPDLWMNYTRTFDGRYYAYLRAVAFAERVVRLERVVSDPATPNQLTEVLGSFTVPKSGLFIALGYVRLADASGNPAVLNLSGVQTLRLVAVDAADDLNLNFMVLAPAGSSVPQQPILTSPTLSAGDFSMSFQSEAGVAYTLESKGSLGDAVWQPLLPAVSGDGTVKAISRPRTSATGFYRVVAR
jgi:hypothetical protein